MAALDAWVYHRAMSFPLFHRPGTIVFLDDDRSYLESLALMLPRHWHVKLFLRPAECIHYLQQEPPFWEADAWNQQQLVEHWRQGKPLIPQVLAYWAKYTERYALSRLCVVDYSMPTMDGLEVLATLTDWPGSRILLTGQADEQIAVRAFNKGLIDQFIPKQTSELSRRLVEAVEHLAGTPHARHAQIWRATLTPEQNALLRQPEVARDLVSLAAQRWVEHVAIGDPFGVLGMDAHGRVSWLQLETAEGLAALAELGEVEGLSRRELEDIRAGRRLANLELRQSTGVQGPCQLEPAFKLGAQAQLLGAVFPVQATGPERGGYNEWLSRQEERRIQE
jgi:CheY-like chemotaxis protein